MLTRRTMLKLAAVALLHPALSWAGPIVPRAPHGYREVRPGVYIAWLEQDEELEGPYRVLLTMGNPPTMHYAEGKLDVKRSRLGVLFRIIGDKRYEPIQPGWCGTYAGRRR